MEGLITQRQAAQRLQISLPTLTAMIAAGSVTTYPGTRKVSAEQIERIRQGLTEKPEQQEAENASSS